MKCAVCGCSKARWLRVNTVAQTFSCDPKSVRRLLKRGQLGGVRFGGEWRVDHPSLDAYVEANRVGFGEDAEIEMDAD
jgi:excisionase family DNA binding protein